MKYKIKFSKTGGYSTYGSGGSSVPQHFEVSNYRPGGTIIFKSRAEAMRFRKVAYGRNKAMYNEAQVVEHNRKPIKRTVRRSSSVFGSFGKPKFRF